MYFKIKCQVNAKMVLGKKKLIRLLGYLNKLLINMSYLSIKLINRWINFTMKGFLYECACRLEFLSGCYWHSDSPFSIPPSLNAASDPHIGTT